MTANRVLQRVDISLRTFYVFNSKFGKTEGEEHKKVIYYYPEETEPNTQIRDVGLSEAIIQFTGTFAEEDDCKALHTQKTTQLLYQPEPGYWMVMVLNVPKEVRTKEGVEVAEYRGNEVHDRIYRATLKHCYQLFRLHKGTFCMNLKEDKEGQVKLEKLQEPLKEFFNAYLPHLKLANCDFLHLPRSIQYLPLDKALFLRAHNLVNMIRATFPVIKETVLLYNEQVVCSGKVDPNDLYSLHDHIFCSLLVPDTPAAPRGSRTVAEQYRNGVFITGAEESEQCSLASKVFVKINNTFEPFYLIVFRALNAIFCLLVEGSDSPPKSDFYTELHAYMAPQLISIANDIGEAITKQQSSKQPSPSGIAAVICNSEADTNAPKYLYINEQSLKHLTNIPFEKHRPRGEGCIPAQILNVIADLNNSEGPEEKDSSPLQEVQVKTTNDFWIVKRRWNWRQCYVIIFNSKATLLDVTQEAKRLFEKEFTDDVFFDK